MSAFEEEFFAKTGHCQPTSLSITQYVSGAPPYCEEGTIITRIMNGGIVVGFGIILLASPMTPVQQITFDRESVPKIEAYQSADSSPANTPDSPIDYSTLQDLVSGVGALLFQDGATTESLLEQSAGNFSHVDSLSGKCPDSGLYLDSYLLSGKSPIS